MFLLKQLIGAGYLVNDNFQFTVTTTTSSETFTILCTNSGTFNATIDWGDGTSTSTITAFNDADLAHTYASAGDHNISISGTFPNMQFSNSGDVTKIKSVNNMGSVGMTTTEGMLYGATNLTSFTVGDADTSLVVSSLHMFRGCSSLTSVDLSSFDTSSVTTMANMFRGCSSLTSLDLSSFDTSSVTTFLNFLRDCTSLTSINLSSFDTSSVTNMSGMFRDCSSLASVDLSSFNTSSVTDMSNMFTNMNGTSSPQQATITGIEDFDITSLSSNSLTFFLRYTSISTTVYDELLVNWQGQIGYNNQNPHFGLSTYTAGSAAATARAALVTAGWSITDEGASLDSDVLLYVPFTDANASTTADGYVLSSGTHTFTSDVFARAGNAVINTDQTKMSGSSTSAYGPAGSNIDGWALDSTISSGLEVGSSSPLSIEFWFYCSNAASGNYARMLSWGGYHASGTGFEVETSNTDYDSFIFYEFTGSGTANRRSVGTYQLTANDWNHIYWAFQPSGSSYVGINGTIYTTSGSYISNFAPTVDLHLLKTPLSADDAVRGYIQEFIVRDSVPYTSNFTPSTTPLL